MSNEEIDEETEKSPLNSANLLISEEKQPFVSLMKQLMILDANLHKKSYKWREHKELLQKIRDNILLFPIPEISLLFHETLIEYARDGIKPLQYTSLEILGSLILYSYDLEEADSIMKSVVSEFSTADSSRLQCLFVDFFEICWVLPFTMANIEDKLFESLKAVSETPYRSVKLRIIKVIPNLQYLLTNPEIQEEFTSILLRFSEEDSTEVQIRADEANLVLFKLKQERK